MKRLNQLRWYLLPPLSFKYKPAVVDSMCHLKKETCGYILTFYVSRLKVRLIGNMFKVCPSVCLSVRNL